MPPFIEIALLLVVIVALLAAFKLLKTAKSLAINAIVGVIILVVANVLGVGVEISLLAVAVCAIGGAPGAILVVILAHFDIAFAGAITPVGFL